MSVKKFVQFVNEAEINPTQASEENMDVVKKELDHYKNNISKLKPLLNLDSTKAQEEFRKISDGNSLLSLEWEVLKLENTIVKAKETIKINSDKINELIKDKNIKLKEMTDRLNATK